MTDVNVKTFIEYGLKDAYLGDAERQYTLPTIHMLFEPIYDEHFSEFCEQVQGLENYVDDYDISDTQVMFVFKIPSKYYDDIEFFKAGKFSRINQEYVKKVFPSFKDPRRKVFVKDPYLRKKIEDSLGVVLPEDAELEGIPLPENEVYRYNGNGWEF